MSDTKKKNPRSRKKTQVEPGAVPAPTTVEVTVTNEAGEQIGELIKVDSKVETILNKVSEKPEILISELTAKLDRLQEELANKDILLQQHDSDFQSLLSEKTEFEGKLTDSKLEISRANLRLETIESKLSAKTSECENLKKELSKLSSLSKWFHGINY